MIQSKARFAVIKIFMILIFGLLIFKMYDLQIVKGDQYRNLSGNKIGINLIEKAPRGEITDKYGNVLVSNRSGYSLQLLRTDIENQAFNDMILRVLDLLEESGVECTDSFPISEYPYQFTFADEEAKSAWFSGNKYKKYLKETMTPEEVLGVYANRVYRLEGEYSANDMRRIIGLRYEADIRGFSATSPCVLAENVSLDVVTRIKEHQNEIPCVAVTNHYVREYTQPGLASHILGRTGKISGEEYAKMKDKGYGYNDTIGKQGVEKSAEQYLRGTDGIKGSDQNVNGKTVTLVEKTPALAGNTVMLTIDSTLQKVAEESLAANINRIRTTGGQKTGADANAGAAVVLDIKNGDALALASYPTYDLERFNADYGSLSQDEDKPLWNRAVSGTYTPGSTFKPLVAIAALENGKITTKEKINDEGIYRFYPDYQPRCWIWQEYHTTHGSINVSKAIEQSCNFFFYETGRRLGIETIDAYAAQFGLGEYTGIELPEETKGSAASPEYKKKLVKTVTDQGWYGGDTLQAAIGQSYHLFTPVQLANYAATIANGGSRYKVNLIKSVRSSQDGSIVFENTPKVEQQINMQQNNLQAVKEGMKNVVDEGSASAIFDGYPIPIGGKTGTAQLGSKQSNNAVFIAFAPFDNPEIAVCVVLEHGVRGANAGYVAKDIFDSYFQQTLNPQQANMQDPTQNTEIQ